MRVRKSAKFARWLAAAIAITGILQGAASAEPLEFKPRVVIPRAFPAIKQPPVVSAAESGQFMTDDELVLGVEVDGKARAYPINMLTGPQREIINDQLGGKAIAATW